MNIRKVGLENDNYYHIISRSIAKYVIFNDALEYSRMLTLLKLYRFNDFNYKLSQFLNLDIATQAKLIYELENENDLIVEIVAFCLMPTHIHLLVKQVKDGGITKYLGRVLNAYSKFFNERHKRNGPLWSGRFKNILVSTDEQLLHLTRYIHLNPTSANNVKNPEDWFYSSYNEYINHDNLESHICRYDNLFNLTPIKYKKFVESRKIDQRNLSIIKNLLIDDYTG